MTLHQNRARVFISCGQAEGEEKDTAIAVAQMLENELGFTVYVAGSQLSFEGVKEAIFRQLVESEYFLFIDFPRGEPSRDGYCSGSLFANQELAVAAYLGLDFLGFRHDRVRPQQGLLRFVQSDFPVFKNNVELLNLVRERVKSDWRNDWKNGLQLMRREDEWDDMNAEWQEGGVRVHVKPARYFHIDVINGHHSRIAVGCVAQIESMRDLDGNRELEFRSSEVKWAGSKLPVVSIPPRTARMLDACVILPEDPHTLYFSSYSDSGKYLAPLTDVSNLAISYLVVSENMAPVRLTLRISVGVTIDDTTVFAARP